jgi:hypothetical protein
MMSFLDGSRFRPGRGSRRDARDAAAPETAIIMLFSKIDFSSSFFKKTEKEHAGAEDGRQNPVTDTRPSSHGNTARHPGFPT